MDTLSSIFDQLYALLRSSYYDRVGQEIGTGKSALTATECYCLEVLLLMREPTISDFASIVGISLPSATYRIGNLIEKGYLQRLPSKQDRRETHLKVTEKYTHFYAAENPQVRATLDAVEESFSPEELAQFLQMLGRVITILRTQREIGDEKADD